MAATLHYSWIYLDMTQIEYFKSTPPKDKNSSVFLKVKLHAFLLSQLFILKNFNNTEKLKYKYDKYLSTLYQD